ncbi:iron uptake protein [Luteimonas sp. MJ246]|uniref:iron uptake protein n=1 Tax=Luteimonas sp. MJ174 TaxID=3129237 RepID=UPI0031BAA030
MVGTPTTAPRTRGTSVTLATTSRTALLSRVAAAVLGGYAFAWGLIAAATGFSVAAGMGFHDAEFLSSLLGVLAYLAALLWTIAARRLWPVWAVLVGGGALLAGVGSAVQAALV